MSTFDDGIESFITRINGINHSAIAERDDSNKSRYPVSREVIPDGVDYKAVEVSENSD